MYAMASMRPNYQPILDTRQNQLGFELSSAEGIDGKALGILGSNVAVLIFIAQAGLQMDGWQWALLILPYVASTVFNIMAIWPQPYRGNVSIDAHPEYLSMDEEDLLLQLLADTEGAVNENAALNRMRMGWYTISLGLSMLGVGLLAYNLLQ
jgi:hypothetical protein